MYDMHERQPARVRPLRAERPARVDPMTELDRLEEMRAAAASERPSWMRRHKKLVMAVAILVAVLTGVGIALALLKKDMPVSGNISGEDGVAAAVFTAASHTGPCTWTVTNGTDRLDIAGAKLASNTTHRCRGAMTVRNDGNVPLRVQTFNVTTTAGTAASGFAQAADCGRIIPVKNADGTGGEAQVNAALNLSSVPVGAAGTLTGTLGLVDETAWSSANCSPTVS